MKRAEIRAWVVMGGLSLAAVVLLVTAILYGGAALWAGALAAGGEAVLAGLAGWGLRLAREQEELTAPSLSGAAATSVQKAGSLGEFRLSYGDDEPVAAKRTALSTGRLGDQPTVQTLETGFQRVVAALLAAGLVVAAVVATWLAVAAVAGMTPGEPIKVPEYDPTTVTLAVLAVAAFVACYLLARRPQEAGIEEEQTATPEQFADYVAPLRGALAMLLPGMLAVAAAAITGWLKMGYINEGAAILVAALLVVQASELLVNSMRSYAAVEELDQEPVDLQKRPLVPILTSYWGGALRLLLAQAVGLGGRPGLGGESEGVMARVLPRVVVALVLLVIACSTVRIVGPGEVAIRERLGEATAADIDHPLGPGLHVMLPWPIDQLVRIPTHAVQEVTVGRDEGPEKIAGQTLDYKFWSVQHTKAGEEEDVFIVQRQQVVGGFVSVWWRVKDASAFYRHVSHSDFLDKTSQQVKPSYEVIVETMAAQTVTQAFAHHQMEDILGANRQEVQEDIRRALQDKLEALGSGIAILDLTIKDVHPPMGTDQPTANGMKYGPAGAYEDVVRALEYRSARQVTGEADRAIQIAQATGRAGAMEAAAEADKIVREKTARTDNLRRGPLIQAYKANPTLVREWLMDDALEEVLPNLRKIFLGKDVLPPEIWQPNRAGNGPLRSAGP